MTRTLQQEVSAVSPPPPTPDALFEHVLHGNPFEVNRVGASAPLTDDAENIHHKPFSLLLELADQARKRPTAIGAMLWGEAGVGKSHLLARLSKWARPDHRQAVFVYLANLQAEPEQLPRSLLRCVVSILTRGRTGHFHDTTLYRLVNATVRHALKDDDAHAPSMQQAEAAYQHLIDDLCGRSPFQAAVVDRQTYAVLFKFFRTAYRVARRGPDDGLATLAVRWLAGDALDPDEALALGVSLGPRKDAGVLADDEQIKQVLIALAQAAWYWQRPLILCFDQADNLEPEQFSALARFLHALLDGAANLLVLTSGVRATLFRWKEEAVLTDSAWDRLAQYEVELQRVSVAEARQIVQARLGPFQEHFHGLEPVKELLLKDFLFPLGEAWSREFLDGKIEVRPRDVINWAREGWRRQQAALRQVGGPAWLKGWEGQVTIAPPPPPPTEEAIQRLLDEKVALKLQEHKRQRQLEPQTLPPDGDNLAGLIHTLLQRCLNLPYPATLLGVERLVPPKYGQRPPYDLVFRQRPGPDGPETRGGLLCLVVGNRTSMSAFLRRVAQDAQPPRRLFLVTDERRPLEPAAAGRQYLEQLRERHASQFHLVRLTFDQYAELDALQAVVGLARSGDLEIELPGGQSRRVGEQEVIDSHHRCDRFRAHPLLRLLLTLEEVGAAPPTPPPPAPGRPNGVAADGKDLREFIMGQLGMTMGASSKELAVKYEAYLLRKQVRLEGKDCKEKLEEAARQMHQDGLIAATPHDDYLYLLLK